MVHVRLIFVVLFLSLLPLCLRAEDFDYLSREEVISLRKHLIALQTHLRHILIAEANGERVVVFVNRPIWKGGNGWALAPTYALPLDDQFEILCAEPFRLTEQKGMGNDIRAAFRSLRGVVELDGGEPDHGQDDLNARRKIRKRVERHLQELKHVLDYLREHHDGFDGFANLSVEEREACFRTLLRFRGDHLALAFLAERNGYEIMEHRTPFIGSNYWGLAEEVGRPIAAKSKRLFELYKGALTREELQEAPFERGTVNQCLATDFGDPNFGKRDRALRQLRDHLLPTELHLIDRDLEELATFIETANPIWREEVRTYRSHVHDWAAERGLEEPPPLVFLEVENRVWRPSVPVQTTRGYFPSKKKGDSKKLGLLGEALPVP